MTGVVAGVDIREVRQSDLDVLYEVCLRTADAGDDASSLHIHPTLPGEVYVGPYVELSDGLGFVAEDDEGPGGYVVAATDTNAFESRCEAEWWPSLRERYPDPGPRPSTPDEELMALIHHPEVTDERITSRFPAHLHIGLLPRLQGRGLGRRLLGRLFSELAARDVPGVHLGVETRNRRAVRFYTRVGFGVVEPDGDDGVIMGLRLDER